MQNNDIKIDAGKLDAGDMSQSKTLKRLTTAESFKRTKKSKSCNVDWLTSMRLLVPKRETKWAIVFA